MYRTGEKYEKARALGQEGGVTAYAEIRRNVVAQDQPAYASCRTQLLLLCNEGTPHALYLPIVTLASAGRTQIQWCLFLHGALASALAPSVDQAFLHKTRPLSWMTILEASVGASTPCCGGSLRVRERDESTKRGRKESCICRDKAQGCTCYQLTARLTCVQERGAA